MDEWMQLKISSLWLTWNVLESWRTWSHLPVKNGVATSYFQGTSPFICICVYFSICMHQQFDYIFSCQLLISRESIKVGLWCQPPKPFNLCCWLYYCSTHFSSSLEVVYMLIFFDIARCSDSPLGREHLSHWL